MDNGVSFTEEDQAVEYSVRGINEKNISDSPSIINLLIRFGVVKNRNQASLVLLVISVVFFSISAFLISNRFFNNNGDNLIVGANGQKYTAEEVRELYKKGIDPFKK